MRSNAASAGRCSCLVLWLLAVGATSGACAASGSASSAGDPTGSGTGSGGAGVGNGSGSGGSGGGDSAPGGSGGIALPPEVEVESSFEVPVATGRFVWVANPTSGRVAYVDAADLTVKTAEAGNAPTYLAALPGAGDAVVVLNALSNDATLLRATAAGLQSRTTIPGIVPGSNGWAASADGRWAIAWTDARRVAGARATQGFQSLTVLDLQAADADPAKAHTTLAVGFRPSAVTFAADSTRAFAVTEDGVSVIALGGASGPRVVANVALDDGAATAASAAARDVSITADGRLAVIRRDGSAEVGVVDLDSGARAALALGGVVTDVDVSADGARAVAVVRDTATLAVIPLAGALPAPADVRTLVVAGETVGQVALTASGSIAVLYSNAAAAQRISVVALGAVPGPGATAPAPALTFRAVRLHAPVLSVFATADGAHAVVLHPPAAPEGATPDGGAPAGGADGGPAPDGAAATSPTPPSSGAGAPVAAAFSLVPLDGAHPALLQEADAPIQAVALAPAGDRALITVRDDRKKTFGVYLGLFPTLEVRRYPLASPPLAAGVVAGAGRGYVAQQHPDGRITFLTLASGSARTLTGYELAARVVDWSQP